MINNDTEKASVKELSDEVICTCYQVTASTIKMAILSGETKSVEDLSELTNAGTACRACICKIERLTHGFPSLCGDCNDCPVIKSEENVWECA